MSLTFFWPVNQRSPLLFFFNRVSGWESALRRKQLIYLIDDALTGMPDEKKILHFNVDGISNKEYNVINLKFSCMCHSPYSSLCGEIWTLGSRNLGRPTIAHKPNKPTLFSLTQMPIDSQSGSIFRAAPTWTRKTSEAATCLIRWSLD